MLLFYIMCASLLSGLVAIWFTDKQNIKMSILFTIIALLFFVEFILLSIGV